jgi:hypothetical protein
MAKRAKKPRTKQNPGTASGRHVSILVPGYSLRNWPHQPTVTQRPSRQPPMLGSVARIVGEIP